jgi:hypothetical protein
VRPLGKRACDKQGVRNVQRAGAVAIAFALGACRGPAEISLGAATPPTANEFFLSPTGNDANPGTTRSEPWKTFSFALRHLQPGLTLTLLDGTYDDKTTGTGFFNITCAAGATTVPNPFVVQDGTSLAPITVRAENQRHAWLKGDGQAGPPLSIDGCSYWNIDGLRADSADFPSPIDTVEFGSVVVLGTDNQHLKLQHLLVGHPNRYKHSHALVISDRSSNVLVEDCELYDFHHNAFEARRTSAITFRRNYVNSRGMIDLSGGYISEYPNGGDYGFFLEETRDVIAENNVVEGVHDGFGIVGRYKDLPADPPVDTPDPLHGVHGNRLLGNVVFRPAGVGVRLDSRCLSNVPCTQPERIVRDTGFIDDVVIGGAAGISSAGASGTDVRQVTVIGAANGLLFDSEPQNAGVPSSSRTINSLAIVQAVAFRAASIEFEWSFDHCAAMSTSGLNSYYVPLDPAHVTGVVAAPPDLGGCFVYLPAGSSLKQAGAGGPVGANVLNRYVDGTLSAMPLWTTSSAFPCGNVIAGVNNEADPTNPQLTSCIGVHKRLHVGTPDCPLP